MTDLSVQGFRVIREIARQGSLSGAADRLDYTQSAISRQLARLERAAGRSLFERHARGVRLTEAGRIVLRHGEAVLGEVEATHEELENLGADRMPRVRIGAFSSALAALVPRAIAALNARVPGSRVRLHEGLSAPLIRRLAGGRLDLAVVIPSEERPEAVSFIKLVDDPLLVAVAPGHPLVGRRAVKPDELRGERWIAGSASPEASLLGAWTGSAWTPKIAHVARDWNAKLGLVAAGQGITVIPGLSATVLPPTLAVVRIDDPAATRPTEVAVSAAAPAERHREAVEALLDSAAELSAELRRDLGV